MEDKPVFALKHHGVKGMKWGVRRKHTRKKTGLSHLSNEELERQIKRLSLEKRYRDLHSSLHVSRGKKITAGVIAAGTAVTAINTLASSVSKAVLTAKPIVKKALDSV